MLTNANILIVDDSKENRIMLEELVKKLGHNCFLAENGLIAVDLLKKEKIDLVLLDIMMPELDGYQTLEKIKANNKLSHTPVVMISTVDEEKSIVKCLKLGADDYIPKPFEPEILKARINNSLQKLESYLNEKELLEKTLTGSLEILINILTNISADVYGKAHRVRRLVKLIAKEYKVEDIWNFEMAAMLSQIGCISVPQEILERATAGKALSPKEMTIYKNHPLIAYKLLKKLPRLEKIADIIKYQHKNYDGSGVPDDGVKNEKIPPGSRLLHVVLAYDSLLVQEANPLKAIDELKENKRYYDVDFLDLLEITVLAELKKEIKNVNVDELKTGMVFAENVQTKSGLKILGKGQEVSFAIIKRLQNISKIDTLDEPLKVIYSKE